MDKVTLSTIRSVAAFGKMAEPALLIRAQKASLASPAAGTALYFVAHAIGAALDITGAVLEVVKANEIEGGANGSDA